MQFLARDGICYSALYGIARSSICPSITRVVRGGSVKDGWS